MTGRSHSSGVISTEPSWKMPLPNSTGHAMTDPLPKQCKAMNHSPSNVSSPANLKTMLCLASAHAPSHAFATHGSRCGTPPAECDGRLLEPMRSRAPASSSRPWQRWSGWSGRASCSAPAGSNSAREPESGGRGPPARSGSQTGGPCPPLLVSPQHNSSSPV